MRSEQEMLALIMGTARADERIRAVIMNGSRVNPNARRDVFQDFDIVYIVTDVASFTNDHTWIDRFGERMILQMPDGMGGPPPASGQFAYLMQFADGNRIDLTLFPVGKLDLLEDDSLSVLLLDKDGLITPFAPPSERSYLPVPPTAGQFAGCCNEFWWVCPYVAKGLWREEVPYAHYVLDTIIHKQLDKMLTWYVGVKTGFQHSPGKCGKHLEEYLEPELWRLLEQTYADARYESTWASLYATCDLFRVAATRVAEHFGLAYPHREDENVSAHLRHVQALPRDAGEMY